MNQVRYPGVLAAHAAWRPEVVPKVPTSSAAEADAQEARRLSKRTTVRVEATSPGWADLLWRVFGVDGWRCAFCASTMRLRMVVDVPPAAARIAAGLLRARGPPGTRPAGDDQGACAET